MDAGGLTQMSHSPFNQANGLAMPTSGLASRRGGQNIKPLSFDALRAPTAPQDNGAPTPRTSRSHLLAGLRTAPKSATAASISNNPQSPTVAAPNQARNNRNLMGPGMYDNASLYSGPKTSMPRYGTGQQQQAYNQAMGFGQQYTVEQILAPPPLQVEEQEQLDPNTQAQLMMANAYFSEQQQQLQQRLRILQAQAMQFQSMGMGMNGQYAANLYQQQQLQQQQLQAMQVQAMMGNAALNQQQQQQQQQQLYVAYDPATGQQTLYVDQGQQQQQAQLAQLAQQQAQLELYQQLQAQAQQQQMGTPGIQVSPPQENAKPFRNNSPPRRYDSPLENVDVIPLPPPSANAFRRGHKKSGSVANSITKNLNSLSLSTEEPRSAGPKTASFPLTPLTAGFAAGHARAGEHPVRQPRNPPSLDELKSKPTAKHEGSKNFVTRTRRSALSNLVRAGLERRKEARSSGSISPISESTEELVETPLTDNDSDSGRSGSGILIGGSEHDDAECSLPSSRTSTGSWGAIGSDRPSSRQKMSAQRGSVDSTASSDNERPGSFASLLKNSNPDLKEAANVNGRAKAMLVLTSAKERKAN